MRRSDQLLLTVSGYLAILLGNATYAGMPGQIMLPEDDGGDRRVREPLPLSITPQLHEDATRLAERLGGTLSRLAEALARADLRTPQPQLMVWPKPGAAKPVWK